MNTRQLIHTTNNAYDMMLLVEGDKVIGSWDYDADQYNNSGDLDDWDGNAPDHDEIEDYGEVVKSK